MVKFNALQVDGPNIQIMWKEIAIIFAIVFLIRLCIDVYIFANYKRICDKFNVQDNCFKLEKKAERLRKVTRFFSLNPWNKRLISIYNNLCCIVASISLINGNEELFVRRLALVKSDKNYELKWFMLALYYRSKKSSCDALNCYKQYIDNNPMDINMQKIMNYFFSCDDANKDIKEFENALMAFKNPVIIKLIEENTNMQKIVDNKNTGKNTGEG